MLFVLFTLCHRHTGAAIVETILTSDELRNQWFAELKEMRDRINGNRQLIVDKLKENGVTPRLQLYYPSTWYVLFLRYYSRASSATTR